MCGSSWSTREAFLRDPSAVLAGYQAHFEQLELGLLLFHHRSCRTTFGIPVGAFTDLYDGPIYQESLHDGDRCNKLCTDHKALRRCPEQCRNSWLREVLHLVDGYRYEQRDASSADNGYSAE